jgi:hypothetical protein
MTLLEMSQAAISVAMLCFVISSMLAMGLGLTIGEYCAACGISG